MRHEMNNGHHHTTTGSTTNTTHHKVDVQAAKRSIQRLGAIYRDIAENADKAMRNRCPYKNAKSQCTAKFGCRNQHFTKNPVDNPICTAKDGLDYRSAWEVNPTS